MIYGTNFGNGLDSMIRFSSEGLFLSESNSSALNSYIAQLSEMGFVEQIDDAIYVSWSNIYSLMDNPDHEDSVKLLNLPELTFAVPALLSSGALSDSNFMIGISGWRNPNGFLLTGATLECGAILRLHQNIYLLGRKQYGLVSEIIRFGSSGSDERSLKDNYQAWGRIRGLAIESGAILDDFLNQTVVLTPENLELKFSPLEVGAKKRIQVEPKFKEAPGDWILHFDRLATVPEYYNIPVAGRGMMHVSISEPVRKVLREIKAMPNRTVSGIRAQTFIRNPYSILGPDSDQVVTPASVEESLRHSGIEFYSFNVSAINDSRGNIKSVEMALNATRPGAIPAFELYSFTSAESLQPLIQEVSFQINRESPCFNWEGYEVELRGDSNLSLEKLCIWKEQWPKPRTALTYEEIFEFKDYSKRVLQIGERKPYYSPFILKTGIGSPWMPNETLVIIGKTSESENSDVPEVLLGFPNHEDLNRFEKEIQEAKNKGKSEFLCDKLTKPISFPEAEEICRMARGAMEAIAKGGEPTQAKKITLSRKALIIGINIQTLDYVEGRIDSNRAVKLAFNYNEATIEYPSSLIGELKPHQKIGVSWLQNLWKNSPESCSGCLVADDMGLGKTLQLLTFIGWYLQMTKPLPVLIVAPVSLLENWKMEIKKFFTPKFAKVLTLYGSSLSELRVARNQIDSRLLSDGLSTFLKDDWIGESNLVLTTYETMRDLSISLGRQVWGIMVCDEAQKIKTPGTLVTDAAKAQKALFKIACTGTPVENSLTDLWCLFDFVQPGLLGPLNSFGLKYRKPIEVGQSEDEKFQKVAIKELQAIIEPQLLRRLKTDVAKDLPKKLDDQVESVRLKNRIPLSEFQKRFYNEAIAEYRRVVAAAQASGTNANPMLSMIHRLRGICADPRPAGLLPDLSVPLGKYRQQSPKFNWLIDRLDEIQNLKEKALIFTEFLDLQRTLQFYLNQRYQLGLKLPRIINGSVKSTSASTENRQSFIDEFQAKAGFQILILSPIAAGFGLNIQAANHVIHYTRPWNPAKEDQATDRAYRIGQKKDVYVYYPTIFSNEFLTFEEKLDQLLRSKRALSKDMFNGSMEAKLEEFHEILGSDTGIGSENRDDALITAETLPRIVGRPFETLCRAIWTKRGFTCLQTRASGDGGIDIVATQGAHGLLIQCKASALKKSLGWEAIKDVIAGAKAYELQFPHVKFEKVAVTNQTFNINSIHQSEINKVTLIDNLILGQWLSEFPLRNSILNFIG